jgi:hypothetical protein
MVTSASSMPSSWSGDGDVSIVDAVVMVGGWRRQHRRCRRHGRGMVTSASSMPSSWSGDGDVSIVDAVVMVEEW